MYFWGFYGVYIIPKWLIKVPDIFQSFLNDFCNFDNFVKIWTRRPPNYHQTTLKIQAKYGNILKQYWMFISENLRVWFFWFVKALGTKFCLSFLFRCGNLSIYFYINFWRWGSENDELYIKHISKSLDINFISIKNMNGNLVNPTNFSIFKEGNRLILISRK